MTKVSPYHTIIPEKPPERDVYHDHSNCADGMRIKPEHKKQGTANRPRCRKCQEMG
jgi:hypothetical protein